MLNFFRKDKIDKKDVCVVFIPKQGKVCAVSLVRKLFNHDKNPEYNLIDINEKKDHFKNHLDEEYAFPKHPKRIILFAHSFYDEVNQLFKLLYYNEKNHEIGIDWWIKNHEFINLKGYDFLYAHVCFGDYILRKTYCSDTFNNYVSFNNEPILWNENMSLEIWSRIFCSIINTVIKDDNESTYKRIRHIYKMEISYLNTSILNNNPNKNILINIRKHLAAALSDMTYFNKFDQSLN